MSDFESRFWNHDGLKLHFRDYAGPAAGVPVLCLHGLTRNARDFHDLACRLAAGRRVLVPDFRGRGRSEHARDPLSYVPGCYLGDIRSLLAEQGIGRFGVIGTSMGGIVAMLLAAGGAPIAAAVLNDIGPVIEPAGLARIRGYVGRASSFPTWMHAARAVQEANADIYPHWGLSDWLAMAKRSYRLTGAGRIVLDYDLKIAEPFRGQADAEAPDMWAAFSALGDVPTLIVRGARSDILSRATAERMAASLPRADVLTVADVGHAPILSEPGVPEAIDRVLAMADGDRGDA
ncbi:Pimeloyl-ACP methyl ester carboxylesterase [Sphingomonas gellani]|uniref:Pimeloyl-ACP methyl ester carboxylesterase n=1 Tax=Sphingomonas gellani TaxID=1166340 RepID=A0A1H8EUU6_9SPHN|nr:alpha/beta hydrolase [Sphingomonas gellani]SEN23401.1 Pimeloyl-ACP methyl ester carboxylesterase [Sphingomonas gellani]